MNQHAPGPSAREDLEILIGGTPMKKLAALILALALVLSAASLALAETPKTKLVVWSFTDELRGMIDKYYVPAHPEVEVVYTLYPTDGSEYRNLSLIHI